MLWRLVQTYRSLWPPAPDLCLCNARIMSDIIALAYPDIKRNYFSGFMTPRYPYIGTLILV